MGYLGYGDGGPASRGPGGGEACEAGGGGVVEVEGVGGAGFGDAGKAACAGADALEVGL